jgi:hypothetical protein
MRVAHGRDSSSRSRFLGGCDDPGKDVSAGDLGALLRQVVAAQAGK